MTTWIAGELLEEGLCSARCLLALSDGPCECSCSGRWHGALNGAQVSEGTNRPAARAVPRGRHAPGEWVREFSHPHIAALPAYPGFRQALSDLGDQADEHAVPGGWPGWLGAIRDMALTAPFADMCPQCSLLGDEDRAIVRCWPHGAERRDRDHVRGMYRCGHGHEWTCYWRVSIAGLR